MLKFKWHEEVKLVKGFIRSCVYDLPRNDYIFIPNIILDSIKRIEGNSICLIEQLEEEDKHWFTIFEQNDYFFSIQEKLLLCFSSLSLKWESPSIITNAIIDVYNEKDINTQIYLIEKLGCKHIAIRFFGVFKKDYIFNLFENNFAVSSFQNVDIYIKNSNELKKSDFIDLCTKYPLINNIFISGSRSKKKMLKLNSFCTIFYLSENDMNYNAPNFNVNITHFTESQKHNTYFNRKLYIDLNGKIKNAPECDEMYGYIQDVANEEELKLIISKPEYQKYWFIYKDIIEICKVCEFRYMCVDARIPLQSENGNWYHETECPYNPYIAKWQGEDGYVAVEECGTYSKEKGFVVNKRKVNKLNKQIWGE